MNHQGAKARSEMMGLNMEWRELPTIFLWIGLAFCLTGPDPQERLGIAAGVNVSGKFDADGDGDLDLLDVAEFVSAAGRRE